MQHRDIGTVYVSPVQVPTLSKGKRCYFVDWFDENRPVDVVAGHTVPGGWRGQVFHTTRDVGAELAEKLGRKLSGSMGPVGGQAVQE